MGIDKIDASQARSRDDVLPSTSSSSNPTVKVDTTLTLLQNVVGISKAATEIKNELLQPNLPAASSARGGQSSDYVQTEEDGQVVTITIGRDPSIKNRFESLQADADAICSKAYHSILNLLNQLNVDEMKSSPSSSGYSVATAAATPSKTIKGNKRPVPQSSSVNKIIIHNSKRTATSSKGSKKKLSYSQLNQVDQESRIESNLDLMTEMSIDGAEMTDDDTIPLPKSTAGSSKKNIGFIASEASIPSKSNIICDSSVATLTDTATRSMKTRSQTRVLTITKTTSTKSSAQSSQTAPLSSGRSTKTRAKAAPKETSATGSASKLVKTKGHQISASTSQIVVNATLIQNTTPSKKRLVNLPKDSLKKAASMEKLSIAGSRSKNNNSSMNTPQKVSQNSGGSQSSVVHTPRMAAKRRAELEEERQQKLIQSTEKVNKAVENKKYYLEKRTLDLRTANEKRMEKINLNKQQLESQQRRLLLADPTTSTAGPSTQSDQPLTKEELRNQERRRKLLELGAAKTKAETQPSSSGKAKPGSAKKPAAPKKAAAPKTTRTGGKKKDTQEDVYHFQDEVVPTKKTKAPASKAKKQQEADEMEEHKPYELHNGDVHDDPILSPIKKVSDVNGGQLNLTFSNSVQLDQPHCSTVVGNSTFAPAHAQPPAFTLPSVPAPKTPKPNSTFNMSKQLIGANGVSTPNQGYEMTPPPRERAYDMDQYDISKYIDSDDEEQTAAAEAASAGKKIPSWAQGRTFAKIIHEQFGQSDEELEAKISKIFKPPVFPVDLAAMGLNCRAKYAQRSSSVNWRSADQISAALNNQQQAQL